jgi:hypothetical protein
MDDARKKLSEIFRDAVTRHPDNIAEPAGYDWSLSTSIRRSPDFFAQSVGLLISSGHPQGHRQGGGGTAQNTPRVRVEEC